MAKRGKRPAGTVKVGRLGHDVAPTVAFCGDQDGMHVQPGKLSHWGARRRKDIGARAGHCTGYAARSFRSLPPVSQALENHPG